MSLMCIIGHHKWDGCKCIKCEKTRDIGLHSWEGCKCTKCEKTRDEEHNWDIHKDCNKCKKCDKTRSDAHVWNGCKCTVCGKTRDWQHNWGKEKCQICGAALSTDELAERWADNLKANKDYHALAKYFCTWHKTLPGEDYKRSVDLWNSKRSPALRALHEAGSASVDAIISEMETGEDDHNEYLAGLLVDIGDTRAVPLLKKLVDRNVWSSSGGNSRVEYFVKTNPQYHGEVEKVKCPICGKVRPVTETKQCGDKRFCEGLCWSKRGRALEHGIGQGCPHYDEGICMAGGRDTGLCSLEQGSYRTSCHVYAMHPK